MLNNVISLQKDVDVEELHSLNSNTKSSDNPTNFPAEVNLHAPQLKLAEDEKRSSDSKSDFVLSDFTSSSDTPRDMAEYIFWTGDETSVTNAIKDFVNQGLVRNQNLYIQIALLVFFWLAILK